MIEDQYYTYYTPEDHLARIRELEREFEQVANIIHQAYHQDQDGGWYDCPKLLCRRIQQTLRQEG